MSIISREMAEAMHMSAAERQRERETCVIKSVIVSVRSLWLRHIQCQIKFLKLEPSCALLIWGNRNSVQKINDKLHLPIRYGINFYSTSLHVSPTSHQLTIIT